MKFLDKKKTYARRTLLIGYVFIKFGLSREKKIY